MGQTHHYDVPYISFEVWDWRRLNERGSTIDQWLLWCKGRIVAQPSYTPYTYIPKCQVPNPVACIQSLVMWNLWQTVSHWGKCSPSTLVSLVNSYYTNCSTFKNHPYHVVSMCPASFNNWLDGKAVPVLNRLSTTPWRCISKWMYRSTFCWPRH
jgi:hypothetical protein